VILSHSFKASVNPALGSTWSLRCTLSPFISVTAHLSPPLLCHRKYVISSQLNQLLTYHPLLSLSMYVISLISAEPPDDLWTLLLFLRLYVIAISLTNRLPIAAVASLKPVPNHYPPVRYTFISETAHLSPPLLSLRLYVISAEPTAYLSPPLLFHRKYVISSHLRRINLWVVLACYSTYVVTSHLRRTSHWPVATYSHLACTWLQPISAEPTAHLLPPLFSLSMYVIAT